MKFKSYNPEAALRIYYTYPEIGNEQLKELFGENTSSSTLTKYKTAVKEAQAKEGVVTNYVHKVNTKVAFRTFGIDVDEVEKRLTKLNSLRMKGIIS